MGIIRIKSFPTFFGAMLGFGVMAAAIFLPVCLDVHHDTDFFKNENCTYSIHSFERPGIELSALFIMPLVGIFISLILPAVSQGFFEPPYRPPQIRY